MNLIAIAAIDLTGSIGNADGSLPWPRLQADMKKFKEYTMGHPIVMGRKTFATFKKPLPGRPHIVLTRTFGSAFQEGVEEAFSVKDALAMLANGHSDAKQAFVIGGAEIYKLFLPYCEFLFLTRIERVCLGDVKFPMESLKGWEVNGTHLQPSGVESPDNVLTPFYAMLLSNPAPLPW